MGPPQTRSLVSDPSLQQALNDSTADAVPAGDLSSGFDTSARSLLDDPLQGLDVNYQPIDIDDYFDFGITDLDIQKLLG